MFGSVRPAGLADTGSTVASTSLRHRIAAPSAACPGHSTKVQPPWKDVFLPVPLGDQGDARGGAENAADCRRQGDGQRPVSAVTPQPFPGPAGAVEHQQRPIRLGIAPCLPHRDKGFGGLDMVDHEGRLLSLHYPDIRVWARVHDTAGAARWRTEQPLPTMLLPDQRQRCGTPFRPGV